MNGSAPGPQEISTLVALFNAGQLDEAAARAQELAMHFPGHWLAWKMLGVVFSQMGRNAEALVPMQKAAALLPMDAETHYNLGITFRALGRLEEAETSIRKSLELNPGNPVAHNSLGKIQQALKRTEEAAASYRQAIQIGSDYAEAHYNLGNALHAMGLLPEAEACFRNAIQVDPDFAEAYSNLGIMLKNQDRFDEARACLERALKINPDLAEIHNNLGIVLSKLGQLNEAQASYHRALQIKPDFVEALINLGAIFQDTGHFEEAEASNRKAIQLNPDNAQAYSNLGAILQELGRLEESEMDLRQAIRIKPDFAVAYYNLGNTLKSLGRLEEAEVSYRTALQIKPDLVEAHRNLGVTLMDKGQTSEAEACYRRALEINPDYADAHSNLLFCMQFIPDRSLAEVFTEHRRFADRFETPLKPNWPKHPNSPDLERRLKIGYVSADFYRHAVAYFIEPVLAHHDKSRFEVYCYYNNTRQDDFTDHLIACADHWVPCKFMSDDQLAERIRADGIDILIDLSGHTSGNRMLVFARKPAPIQVTYVGYPGTSGLSAMDYRITDNHTNPEGSDVYYSEKLLRLPDSMWCYRPSEDMPEVEPLPALRNGYITFGSLNNFNKINDQCIELWAKLLKAVPDSRLIMVTVPEGAAREQLLEKFSSHGIAAGRLDCVGKLPFREFHRMFRQVDITLDPVFVNGATTTCESLWMGVPVLSLAGDRFLSRAGLSILSAAGLPDFSPATREEYLEVAVRFADNIPALAQLHDGLRARIAASPLCHEMRFTRNLENVFREIWEKWCKTVT